MLTVNRRKMAVSAANLLYTLGIQFLANNTICGM